MENIVLQKRWVQGGNVVVDDLRGTVFTGEAGAHTFQISGVDSAQETVAITGTITGRFLTATNVTVPLTGSVSDGVASLTLTEDCYVVPGRFVLSVFATNGSTTQCIYCAVGNVFRTQSEIIEYPSASIPDIEQIIADAQEAVTEINAEVTAAQAAVAAAQTAVDGIEAQRQTMIASIASVAGQGTDTTLSQSGVAADAKAAGDQISDLKSAIGNLNNLDTTDKSSVVGAINETYGLFTGSVGEAVSDWLDDHPEATTTVQDHSLTYEKLVNGTLGFVTPEMFGAKGNGTANDTTAIRNAISFASSNACKCEFSNGKTYCISETIALPLKADICGNGATIKAISQIQGSMLYFATSDAQNRNVIDDFILDGNGLAQGGIFNDSQNTRCYKIKITGCTAFGITNQKGDCSFDSIDIIGNENSTSFVGIIDIADSYYSNCTLINCTTGIRTTYNSTWVGIHAWMWTTSLLEDSVFCGGNCSGSFIGCYIDTYHKGFALTTYNSSLSVIGCYFHVNEAVYNSSNVTELPVAFYIPENVGSTRNTTVIGCRFTSVSQSAGFGTTGYYFQNYTIKFTRFTIYGNIGENLLNYAPHDTHLLEKATNITGDITISATQDTVTISGNVAYSSATLNSPMKICDIPTGYEPIRTWPVAGSCVSMAGARTVYSCYVSDGALWFVPTDLDNGSLGVSVTYNRYSYYLS